MPSRPLRPCATPNCPQLVTKGRCEAHARAQVRELESRRPSARERGYTPAWDRYSKAFLREHPLCMCPEHLGREDAPAATVTDHVHPHRGDMTLFWDPSNHQALAKACHDRKTALEDGRWGKRL